MFLYYLSSNWLYQEKNRTPHAENVDLISLDFQSILPRPSGISENVPLFFALNPLEIHYFPRNFGILPWIPTTSTLPSGIVPLIFLTRKLRIFFLEKSFLFLFYGLIQFIYSCIYKVPCFYSCMHSCQMVHLTELSCCVPRWHLRCLASNYNWLSCCFC